MKKWTLKDSQDLYYVEGWGAPYFSINDKGNVAVTPGRQGVSCDVFEIVSSLERRGINSPVLLRFDGIIRDRVKTIDDAFQAAIAEYEYSGKYTLAFPIKVNQQRHVVEAVRTASSKNPVALEAGSKPELLAVLATHEKQDAFFICNGYKDQEYIELAIRSQKIGRRPIIVIEQLSELDLILKVANRFDMSVDVGVRMKPITRGVGRWESSGGDRAKFGLTTAEILKVIRTLEDEGKADWLKLLHYHAGSQISSIAAIKRVLRECARMYTEIARLAPSISFLDVGGGLAVDYDGSKTNFTSSSNYSEAEYARDVVGIIQEFCSEAGVDAPHIVSESGRATVAQHALLVTEVTSIESHSAVNLNLEDPPSDHFFVKRAIELWEDLTGKSCREVLHDLLDLREQALEGFIRGEVSLEERAFLEIVFKKLAGRITLLARDLRVPLEGLERLEQDQVSTFFCNFSVFQSAPDAWAIDQLFPIMPIHRHLEEPDEKGVIADLTCDSDGKIDKFIDLRDVAKSLRVHSLPEEGSYYLGIFLIGAYQEILGDLHNLFGDTNAVHVEVGEDGSYRIIHTVPGDSMREVLEYVEFSPAFLMERLRDDAERALQQGMLNELEARALIQQYQVALDGYTYLVKEESDSALSYTGSNSQKLSL